MKVFNIHGHPGSGKSLLFNETYDADMTIIGKKTHRVSGGNISVGVFHLIVLTDHTFIIDDVESMERQRLDQLLKEKQHGTLILISQQPLDIPIAHVKMQASFHPASSAPKADTYAIYRADLNEDLYCASPDSSGRYSPLPIVFYPIYHGEALRDGRLFRDRHFCEKHCEYLNRSISPAG